MDSRYDCLPDYFVLMSLLIQIKRDTVVMLGSGAPPDAANGLFSFFFISLAPLVCLSFLRSTVCFPCLNFCNITYFTSEQTSNNAVLLHILFHIPPPSIDSVRKLLKIRQKTSYSLLTFSQFCICLGRPFIPPFHQFFLISVPPLNCAHPLLD